MTKNVLSCNANNISKSVTGGMIPLRKDFTPTPEDVICSRGNIARNHKGNVKFRDSINENLEKYSMAKSKIEKSNIVWSIVKNVRSDSPNGGFVKKINSIWYEVGDHLAREKVGQSLRDSLHSQYKSSNKAKKRRRQEEQAKVDDEICNYLYHQTDCRNIINLIQNISNLKMNDSDLQQKFNQANSTLLHIFKRGDQKNNNNYDYHEQQNHFNKRSKRQLMTNTNAFGFDGSSPVLQESPMYYNWNMEPIPLNDNCEFDHHVFHYVPLLSQ